MHLFHFHIYILKFTAIYVLHAGISTFQFAFLVTSTVLFAGGIVVFFGLVSSPKELGKNYYFTIR